MADTPDNDYPANSTTPGSAIIGSSVTGYVEAYGFSNAGVDWFRVDLTAGQSYVFDLRGSSTGGGSLSDPALSLYAPAASTYRNPIHNSDFFPQQIDRDQDDGVGADAQLAHTAERSGTYFLAVRGQFDAEANTPTGTYTLEARDISAPVRPEFGQSTGWTSDNRYPRELGDVNGDGRDDIVGFGENGVLVSLATGGWTFAAPTLVRPEFGQSSGWESDDRYPRELVDVNGDGRDDIVGYGHDGVLVSLATGGGNFAAPTLVRPEFGQTSGWEDSDRYPRELADVNGDGRQDIVGFGYYGVLVSLATGSGNFGEPTLARPEFGQTSGWTSDNRYPRELADVNGDSMADIVGFGENGVLVSLATGGGTFAAPTMVLSEFSQSTGWTSDDRYPRELADVNGDNMADIVGFGEAGVGVSLATGGGSFAAPRPALNQFGQTTGWTSDDRYPRELADVDGNGQADIVAFGESGVHVAPAYDWLLYG